MLKPAVAFWFKKTGWRFSGNLPKKEKKSFFVVGPNTSRRDLFLAVAIIHFTHFKARILVHKKWWNPIYTPFLKHVGAAPFDYNDRKASWQTIINQYNERKKFSIIFCPDPQIGTHNEWQPDFLEAMKKLDIPIVMVHISQDNKMVKFHTMFYPSGDNERDLRFMDRSLFGPQVTE